MIGLVIVALFGLLAVGLVLDHVGARIRNTESADDAERSHRRLMGEIERPR